MHTKQILNQHDSSITALVPFCHEQQCIYAQRLEGEFAQAKNLSFYQTINNRRAVWRYRAPENSAELEHALSNQLILLFPGFNHPTLTLSIHQRWLEIITGADVYVMPSADESTNFKFGLDQVVPTVAEINRRKPEHVHLIGFSMGAVAAHAISAQLDNSTLHLVAPMTDFKDSAKALRKSSLYDDIRWIVSEDTLDAAVEIVHEKSGISEDQLDLIGALGTFSTDAHIYVSTSDYVTPASYWEGFNIEGIDLHIYIDLSHLESITLGSNSILVDFASNLLGRPINATNDNVLGTFCIEQIDPEMSKSSEESKCN